MSGRSPPLYCTLILITMHSHQSYPNITTVIHSYEYSTTVDNSTIETYRNRGLGKSKMYISILYNIIHCHARVFYGKKRTNLDLLSITRLWGEKTNTQTTREAWDTTQFSDFVTLHL